MIERARTHDVIDFFWEWQKRRAVRGRNTIAELALDRCEETLQRGDWGGFGYWHGIYCRERALNSYCARVGCGIGAYHH